MGKLGFIVLAAAAVAASLAAPSLAVDGAACKEILASKSPLIVTVKFVLKADVRGQTMESNQEALGVVADESGLIMLASGNLGGTRRVGGRGGSMEIKTAPSDFKVIFGNETDEYEAVLAAKDSKLNLGFVQIKDLKGKKIQALKFDGAADPQIGQELVGVMRYGRGFDYAPHFAMTMVSGEIKMPRQMWALTGDFGTVGLPAFDASGKAVGVLAVQDAGESEEGGMNLDRMIGNLFGGGRAAGGNSGVFLLPGKTIAATIELAKKQAAEALQKAKEEGGSKPEEKKEGEDKGGKDEGGEEHKREGKEERA